MPNHGCAEASENHDIGVGSFLALTINGLSFGYLSAGKVGTILISRSSTDFRHAQGFADLGAPDETGSSC